MRLDGDYACNKLLLYFYILLLLSDEIGNEAEIESDLSLVTGKMRVMGVNDNVNGDINSCNALSAYTAGKH